MSAYISGIHMLVDTHCHIHDARFDDDRAEVINRARHSGVNKMITIGCDIETTRRALSLAQIHKDIYFSAGFHPHEAKHATENFVSHLRSLAMHRKCVAIGECGLDYYYGHSPKDTQKTIFEEHLKLSIELQKTLVIHVRDAYDDCLDIIRNFPTKEIPVVIHCFSSTKKIAEQFLSLGCYLSIPGILTFKEPGELTSVVEITRFDRLLVETDSPYLAPLPYRGKRNEPAYVVETVQKIAQIKQVDFAEATKILTQNSFKVFGLRDTV